VLDEPTAGVDTENQAALHAALRLLQQRGGTIMVVTHELGPMAALLSRAVILREGRVVYDGVPLERSEWAEDTHDHHHRSPRRSTGMPDLASPLDWTSKDLS
jgi:zinc transport system ATP-binding protein